jgi:hypothetical protein
MVIRGMDVIPKIVPKTKILAPGMPPVIPADPFLLNIWKRKNGFHHFVRLIGVLFEFIFE